MGLFKLLMVYVCLAMVVLQSVESAVFIRLDRVPPARTRHSTAVFRYSVTDQHAQNPCRNHECSFYCELDNQPLKSCPQSISFSNLTQNRYHYFLLNVTTSIGERNSSAYKWYIDTEPPTASIFTEKNFTNAAHVTIFITFSEACTGHGGFKCVNASSCNVMVNGPASLNASTLQIVDPDITYSLVIDLSISSMYGRVVVKMEDRFCTDQAGNLFTRKNSSIVIHFDRRPVYVDLWTSVPSYELQISRVLRTVIATNKTEDLEIFLEFSDPVMNSTGDIMNVLHANAGYFLPLPSGIHGNRRFGFKLKNVSGTEIITVKLHSTWLIGRSGTAVSPVVPIVFLYDSTKPSVKLSTRSPLTKETKINVIVEFTKPVFGFDASGIEVGGGRLERFKEISKALYSLTILDVSQDMVSVMVPEGKAKDIAGNLNLASDQLEVRHYSTPAVSFVLQSFVTAGLLATSLAAAVLALSSANLAAVGGLTSVATHVAISDPSRNLLGTIGHLQVFVFSDWLSVSLPIEYSETTKGLRWLIPREKLPWKKEDISMWPQYPSAYEVPRKLSMDSRGMSGGYSLSVIMGMKYSVGSNSSSIASLLQNKMPSPNHATPLPIISKHYGIRGWPTKVPTSSFQDTCRSDDVGDPHSQHNVNVKSTPYGLPLNSSEYFIYFLRGEPLSAGKAVKSMENDTGWKDFGMNMFWLGVAGGSLLTTHLLILVFLRWRTGTTVHGVLSVPRFELFLLILMIPCMCQSSVFIIRGGTTAGIIAGSLLLAIPASLLLSVCLFLIVAIFMGSFVQYKEVKTQSNDPWHTKLLFYFTGKPAIGKWFHRDGLPSSFIPRFGILFEDRKGPPVYILADRNDPTSIPERIDSSQSGIGRMRAVSSEGSIGEIKIHTSKRILGCARSAYLIVDLLRRVGLGIISGAYLSHENSHGQIQCILALGITLVQFLYLLFLKPYIMRGVHVAESISLLCEVGVFSLSFYIEHWKIFKDQKVIGIVMLTLLFISFAGQLVNEWYALIKGILRLPQPHKSSFKLGLKWVAKGLILPFLPRKQWSRILPGSFQPKTGLVPVVPLSPETELERQDNEGPQMDTLSSMTATVVPVYSPDMPRLTEEPQPSTSAQADVEINVGSSLQSVQMMNQRSRMRTAEGKQPKSDTMNETLKKLSTQFEWRPSHEEGALLLLH
ncbi:hypothetical protein MRB53_027530 [Persea americana]|uniref:Uncharacterized protein n=1 Tax=Persea americana TaxID=3435 RepID=A0ACC2LL97_PERAE|nr:hypothetical protein MRB53_027530 [Persea americana]